jgi:hypothetical protein
MRDIATPLNNLQQFTMAGWAIKTAMVFESLTRVRHCHYTRDERHELRSFLRPPPTTIVWLGRFSGRGNIGCTSHTVSYAVADDGVANGYACTILIGRLLLQVFSLHFSVNREEEDFHVPVKNGIWDRLLVQISPCVNYSVLWPPEGSIPNIPEFAYRFALGSENPYPR